MPGYSGKPVSEKLGLKAAGSLLLLRVPAEVRAALNPLPLGASVKTAAQGRVPLLLLCVSCRDDLIRFLAEAASKLTRDGALWIAWPKKTSPLYRDLTEDGIREIVLPTGLVDVKVCAVSEDWSGLKLVVRKTLREAWESSSK
jgi:hypothetical protein